MQGLLFSEEDFYEQEINEQEIENDVMVEEPDSVFVFYKSNKNKKIRVYGEVVNNKHGRITIYCRDLQSSDKDNTVREIASELLEYFTKRQG